MSRQLVNGLRYVVTGGAGFIGSHLCETLVARGHRVLAVDNLSTGSRSNLERLESHPSFSFELGDITKHGVLDRLVADADVVIHFAAAVGVKLIVDQPRATILTNLDGTQRALEAAERHGFRLVVASSSEVYGKSSSPPFSEEDDVVLGPSNKSRWSYAAAKMMGEFLTFAYCREAGVDATTLRFFNTIGPRQSGQYGMVAPRFVRQALEGSPLTVYGEGFQSRCFCDVRDVVAAVVAVAENPSILSMDDFGVCSYDSFEQPLYRFNFQGPVKNAPSPSPTIELPEDTGSDRVRGENHEPTSIGSLIEVPKRSDNA